MVLTSAVPLPAHSLRPGRAPDIRLLPGSPGAFPARRGARHWFTYRRLPNGDAHLRWNRLFEFLVSRDGRAIRYRGLNGAPAESLTAYLLGQVLSFSLLALGVDPLHGTAVAVDGGAVVFLGDCGSGKSTLGAAMLSRGFPIVTDDLVAMARRGRSFVLHPGPARIKLFPNVARRLVPERTGTPMVQGTTKRILSLTPHEMATRPLPVRAFYLLEGVRGRRGVRVEALGPGDACVELLRAAFNLSVTDRRRLAAQFRFVSKLAQAVPVRRLSYPRLLASLPAVCDAVLADLRS